jgi:hypothetical protein
MNTHRDIRKRKLDTIDKKCKNKRVKLNIQAEILPEIWRYMLNISHDMDGIPLLITTLRCTSKSLHRITTPVIKEVKQYLARIYEENINLDNRVKNLESSEVNKLIKCMFFASLLHRVKDGKDEIEDKGLRQDLIGNVKMYLICIYGNSNLLKYFNIDPTNVDDLACDFTIVSGNKDCAKAIFSHISPPEGSIKTAVYSLDIEMLYYIYDEVTKTRKYIFSSEVLQDMITYQNLDMMTFAQNKGCEWDIETYRFAARSDNPQLIAFIVENNPDKSYSFYNIMISNNCRTHFLSKSYPNVEIKI